VTATGLGCKEVVASSSNACSNLKTAAVLWKTRGHKSPVTESSCTLLLAFERSRDVTIHITFTEGATVPASVSFEHAPSPTSQFSLLGKVDLQVKSTTQLKHVFRLGEDVEVDRCLRITCFGHVLSKASATLHSVCFLAITGQKGLKSRNTSHDTKSQQRRCQRGRSVLKAEDKTRQESSLEKCDKSSPPSDQHSAVGCSSRKEIQEEAPSYSILITPSGSVSKFDESKKDEFVASVKNVEEGTAPWGLNRHSTEQQEDQDSQVNSVLAEKDGQASNQEDENATITSEPRSEQKLNYGFDISVLEEALTSELARKGGDNVGQVVLRAIRQIGQRNTERRENTKSASDDDSTVPTVPPTAENSDCFEETSVNSQKRASVSIKELIAKVGLDSAASDSAAGDEKKEEEVEVKNSETLKVKCLPEQQPVIQAAIQPQIQEEVISSPVARILASSKSLIQAVRTSATMQKHVKGDTKERNGETENKIVDKCDSVEFEEEPLVATSSWHQPASLGLRSASYQDLTHQKDLLLHLDKSKPKHSSPAMVKKFGKGKRVSFSLPSSPTTTTTDNNTNNNKAALEDSPLIDVALAKKLVRRAEKVRRSWEQSHGSKDASTTDALSDGFRMLQGQSRLQQEEELVEEEEEEEEEELTTENGCSRLVLQPLDTSTGFGYPTDLDAFIAQVIAKAGNTPTGPLARGARQGPADLFNGDDIEALRKAATFQGQVQRKALLEPLVPAPLEMGMALNDQFQFSGSIDQINDKASQKTVYRRNGAYRAHSDLASERLARWSNTK
jgi:hypothetical protein